MEKGEVPGLGHSEAQAGFSSLGTADNLPARSSGASQPQGSQLRQELCQRLSACCMGLGGGAPGLSDLLTERCTKTVSSVSMGKAAQCRSWLASRWQGDGPFPCLSLPVQTDHGTASELLKNSSSQPANMRSFIILEQAGGSASCFQPGPLTKPMPNSSAAWRGAGIRLGGPGPSKMPFHVLGVLEELPCPRLGACAFLSHSPSTAASCRDSLERMRGLA